MLKNGGLDFWYEAIVHVTFLLTFTGAVVGAVVAICPLQ
jgi:ABC-type molybdate transport system permease subunit